MKIETLIVHGPCIFSAFAISLFTRVEIAAQLFVTQPLKVQKVQKAEKYDALIPWVCRTFAYFPGIASFEFFKY